MAACVSLKYVNSLSLNSSLSHTVVFHSPVKIFYLCHHLSWPQNCLVELSWSEDNLSAFMICVFFPAILSKSFYLSLKRLFIYFHCISVGLAHRFGVGNSQQLSQSCHSFQPSLDVCSPSCKYFTS